MVGYAEPCPLCGNNKRRRFGVHYSRSAEAPCQQQSTLPEPEGQPKSVSDPLPSPAPCTAVEAVAPPPRHEDPPAIASPAAVNQRDHSDSSEGSSPSTAPFQTTVPAATAAGAVSAPPPAEAVALQEKADDAIPENVIKIEDAVSPKEEEGGPPPPVASEESEEVATMYIKCKCGRRQEFLYRQKRA